VDRPTNKGANPNTCAIVPLDSASSRLAESARARTDVEGTEGSMLAFVDALAAFAADLLLNGGLDDVALDELGSMPIG
jgi:hypothetical protein